jgi:hypothetical protein
VNIYTALIGYMNASINGVFYGTQTLTIHARTITDAFPEARRRFEEGFPGLKVTRVRVEPAQ